MNFSESDLYEPIKAYFTALGYEVKGEVCGFDVVLTRGEALTIIEMKKALNLTLLLQAMDGKKLTPHVYVAIGRPKNLRKNNITKAMNLLRKLELGLIMVALDSPLKTVEVLLTPEGLAPKASRKRNKVISEFQGRTLDLNTGGVTKRKLLTAFREKCIQLFALLYVKGPMHTKEIKEITGIETPSSILASNFYGWFSRTDKATYTYTDKGLDETREFHEMLTYYLDIYK